MILGWISRRRCSWSCLYIRSYWIRSR